MASGSKSTSSYLDDLYTVNILINNNQFITIRVNQYYTSPDGQLKLIENLKRNFKSEDVIIKEILEPLNNPSAKKAKLSKADNSEENSGKFGYFENLHDYMNQTDDDILEEEYLIDESLETELPEEDSSEDLTIDGDPPKEHIGSSDDSFDSLNSTLISLVHYFSPLWDKSLEPAAKSPTVKSLCWNNIASFFNGVYNQGGNANTFKGSWGKLFKRFSDENDHINNKGAYAKRSGSSASDNPKYTTNFQYFNAMQFVISGLKSFDKNLEKEKFMSKKTIKEQKAEELHKNRMNLMESISESIKNIKQKQEITVPISVSSTQNTIGADLDRALDLCKSNEMRNKAKNEIWDIIINLRKESIN